MFDVIKKMQKQGIFKLLPNDGLDDAISKITTPEQVDALYNSIQKYLKKLYNELSYIHNVDLGSTLSDFKDKFSFIMYDIPFRKDFNLTNGIYQSEIDLGTALKGSFGISALDSTFNLEELKLLKLINHYYITLSNKNGFTSDYIFIPIDTLKLMFPKVNNIKLKEKIIKTSEFLSSKTIYWNLTKTNYAKKDDGKDLYVGNKEKLVDINILFFPKKNKNGVNGEALEVKGIICRITKFMKLRKNAFKQISNRFPIDALKANYLSFMISEKIDYRLNMIKQGSKKKNNDTNYDTKLRDLLDSIYLYKDNKVQSDTYLYQIMNEVNSKANIYKILEAIITSLNNLSNNIEFTPLLVITHKKKKINLTKYMVDLSNASNSNECFNVIDKLYEEIIKLSDTCFNQAEVMQLIKNGHISLVLDL